MRRSRLILQLAVCMLVLIVGHDAAMAAGPHQTSPAAHETPSLHGSDHHHAEIQAQCGPQAGTPQQQAQPPTPPTKAILALAPALMAEVESTSWPQHVDFHALDSASIRIWLQVFLN